MSGDLKDAKIILANVNNMILVIKGKGGYKVRQLYPVTDLEFDEFYKQTVGTLQRISVGIVVAERMLKEPAPSIHDRWDEYLRWLDEVMVELAIPGGKT